MKSATSSRQGWASTLGITLVLGTVGNGIYDGIKHFLPQAMRLALRGFSPLDVAVRLAVFAVTFTVIYEINRRGTPHKG